MAEAEIKVAPKKNAYTSAVGRRKQSVARVRLFSGSAPVTVNGKPIGEVFAGVIAQKKYLKPFEVTQTLEKYTATIKLSGGGTSSGLDAVVHGLARALNKVDATLRDRLKKEGLLTRDPRVKESRKYGNAQKARAGKQSPKR